MQEKPHKSFNEHYNRPVWVFPFILLLLVDLRSPLLVPFLPHCCLLGLSVLPLLLQMLALLFSFASLLLLAFLLFFLKAQRGDELRTALILDAIKKVGHIEQEQQHHLSICDRCENKHTYLQTEMMSFGYL